MSDDSLAVTIFSIIIIAILFLFFSLVDMWSCHSKWSEYKVSYGPIQGCMIKVNDKFIPAENYRVIE